METFCYTGRSINGKFVVMVYGRGHSDRTQQAQSETEEVPFEHQETLFFFFFNCEDVRTWA